MKILTVIGARPQFIKAAAVSRALKFFPEIKEIIVHTGQHFDHKMSQIFFDDLGIPKPKYNLNINSQSHGAMTGKMLQLLEELIVKEKPDWVLVYGDTNSTLAGALAASKLHVRVAHVEAGLRSNNMKMPEEVNRIITDNISNLLFCPTLMAVNNLEKEGFLSKEVGIKLVGDVMYDSVLYYKQIAKNCSIDLPSRFLLCTIHRAENTDSANNLKEIIKALNEVSSTCDIVLPLHPRTKSKININDLSESIKLIEPVGYLEMLNLIDKSEFILTDSGGLQKEAYFFQKPCITLREETEWVELVDEGVNFLAGPNFDKILKSVEKVRNRINLNFNRNLYGNGDASKLIVHEILNF